MGQEELEQMTEVYNMLVAYLVNYSFQIFGAVVVLVLGVFVGRRLSNLVLALCAKKSLDITLSRFFASSARIAIISFSVLIALSKLGIQVTPFLAAVGALAWLFRGYYQTMERAQHHLYAAICGWRYGSHSWCIWRG